MLEALDLVATANWGEHTPSLHQRARVVKTMLQSAEREESS
jgi:hypothetical protein